MLRSRSILCWLRSCDDTHGVFCDWLAPQLLSEQLWLMVPKPMIVYRSFSRTLALQWWEQTFTSRSWFRHNVDFLFPATDFKTVHAVSPLQEVGFWAVQNLGRDLELQLMENIQIGLVMGHLTGHPLVHPHSFGENSKNRHEKPVSPGFPGTEITFILVRHVMKPAHEWDFWYN